MAGALLVTVLSINLGRAVAGDVEIPPELASQVSLEDANFVSNDQLRAALAGTDATAAQTAGFVAINTQARLNALKIGASRPRYRPLPWPAAQSVGRCRDDPDGQAQPLVGVLGQAPPGEAEPDRIDCGALQRHQFVGEPGTGPCAILARGD